MELLLAQVYGKTVWAKASFVLHGYNYCKENNLPFYCIYFALEESVEKFWVTITASLLKDRYNLELTYYQYKGFHAGFTDKHKQAIELLQPEIDEMKKQIHVYDYVSNPTGMYKTVQKFMETIGKKIMGIEQQDEHGNKFQSFEYQFSNPDTQCMVITDHLGLLTPEKNPYEQVNTVHLAMKKWSEYCVRYIAKKYKCIVVQIHQQDVSGDSAENIRMGRPEPTIDKLSLNKIISQDYYVLMGIFSPTRVNPPITKYGGYEMKDFKGYFRSIHILKHRDGEEGVIKPMLFLPSSSKYLELPKPGTPELEKLIKQIK